ncbi:MAG: sulfatase-like hydrolase/transferase [Chloroflexi bacterium]|nr:sulfatase-like hydrolase/transferase [Chloroflexota bacterium]
MGRKILFITTDQQRYDSLGYNGGQIARTPVIDHLAATGINYRRAHNQNVVCMPSRATLLTGQMVRTHGVWANGVPLPADAPSVAAYLHDIGGYRTALIGKAHFEPALDFSHPFPENTMALQGSTGPHRGFEHLELAMHSPVARWHYGKWLRQHFPGEAEGFFQLFVIKDGTLAMNHEGGGDTGAPQVAYNPIPREHYHTDWVADRTMAYLDTLSEEEDWFIWMSFPDPHHPWDPPASEARRVNWRDLDLPPGHPGSEEHIVRILSQKPRHWLEYYDGRTDNLEGAPGFVPRSMTHDQVREINALIHVKNELIDEACGRVLGRIRERGWENETDVFFASDHGELQGDFGLLFKGPYHTDALMRVPLIWRPAPSASIEPAVVPEPVGLLDLAPTFCHIADLPVPAWMQGSSLPTAPGSGRERVITEWDSQQIDQHLRTIYRDSYICTVYEGSPEGELYNVERDPLQWDNLWDDPGYASLRSDLVADLYDHLPAPRDPLLEPVARV